mgnify:CR=1 FL=1
MPSHNSVGAARRTPHPCTLRRCTVGSCTTCAVCTCAGVPMSTQTISVAAAALGVGWGIGLVYPGSDLPSYAYYASPLELPLTLIALGLALALLFPSEKKAGALTKCPVWRAAAGRSARVSHTRSLLPRCPTRRP